MLKLIVKDAMEKKRTILVAEPKPSLCEELSIFSKINDLNMICVNTPTKTLQSIQNNVVDVLVLDADLLREEVDFISVIKGIDENLPIIVCAETNTPELESKFRHQGIFFYHIKSFGMHDLEMAILNALNKL